MKTQASRSHAIWLPLLTLILVGGLLMSPNWLSASTSTKVSAKLDGNQIVVQDNETGRTLHTLAKPAGVIREVHALKGGAVVATTTKDRTIFWDAATGKQLQEFGERIYAFTPDQTKFITFTESHDLLLRNAEDMSLVFTLDKGLWGGIQSFLFSPNGKYLVVQINSAFPLSDEQFEGQFWDAAFPKAFVYALSSGVRVYQGGFECGAFSDDERFYVSSDNEKFDLVQLKIVQDSNDNHGGQRK